jgi:hypothetical protein
VAFVLLFGLWMCLVATLVPVEAYAGLGASAIGATAYQVARRGGLQRFEIDPRWLVRARVLPVRVITDFLTLMAALGRHLLSGRRLRGRFVAVAYGPGGMMAVRWPAEPSPSWGRRCRRTATSWRSIAERIGSSCTNW